MQNISDVTNFRSFKDVPVGRTEEEVKIDLAACYRLVALYGMTDLAANHITARVPGRQDQFFINPYGMLYEEITASSLYKIDIDGNVVERPDVPYGVNVAGYVIHSAIHAMRHDVDCVLHTHTRAGVAVACMTTGLIPIHQNAMLVAGNLAYHDYEGPVTSADERKSLVRDLGSKNCLILRNHGLLTCGRTIAEAFYNMYRLDTACRIQVDLMASGSELVQPNQAATASMDRLLAGFSDVPLGNLEWRSLRRKLDRLLPGYEQ